MLPKIGIWFLSECLFSFHIYFSLVDVSVEIIVIKENVKLYDLLYDLTV